MRVVRLVAAVLTVLGVVCGARAADLATVVPDDAFFYAEIRDPRGVWTAFERSAAWDAVRSLPGGEFRFRAAAGALQQMLLAKLGIRWGEFVDRHVERAAVVLLDVPVGSDVEPCVLLDCAERKADLESLLRDTVEPTLRASTPGTGFDDVVHQGVAVRLVNLPKRTVGYAFLDGRLALGPYAAVKDLISRRARRPLAASVAFAKARHKLAPPRGLLVYVNVQRLLERLRPQLAGDPSVARGLDDLGLSGVQFALAASAFEGRRVRDTLYLHTGGQRVGLLRLLAALSPGPSRAGEVLPNGTPGFLAVTFRDGPELWDAILDYMAEGGEVERIARLDANQETLRLRLGIDFHRDFVRALGGEIFLAADSDLLANDASTGQRFEMGALPFILGFRVADREALEVTLHRLIMSQPAMGQGVQRTTAEHRGVEVNSLSLPGQALRPAYAFVGEYLLVAKSAGVLRQCIDAREHNETLGTARDADTSANQNVVIHLDLARFVAALGRSKSGPRDLASHLGAVCARVTGAPEGLALTIRSPLGLLGTAAYLQAIRAVPGV
jgi:hypothetical protein